MNILFVSGSRNPEGRTARAVNAVLEGAKEAGSNVELVFLPELNLERCRQCDQNGWGLCRSEGHCIVEDDFNPMLEKVRKADVCVFASPVYFSDLSESMLTFLGKIRRTIFNPEAAKVLKRNRWPVSAWPGAPASERRIAALASTRFCSGSVSTWSTWCRSNARTWRQNCRH